MTSLLTSHPVNKTSSHQTLLSQGSRALIYFSENGESPIRNVLTVVLAGGKGTRLEPLTRDRAKPAVPFGGSYRIVDFSLSNCLNSGLRKILVLTQYKAMSLDRHINLGWRKYFCHELGEFIDVVPPQQRIDEHWYQGTADAVYQNIYAIEKGAARVRDHPGRRSHLQDELPDDARLSPREERRRHDRRLAGQRSTAARDFGVMQIDEDSRIIGFEEKKPNPKTIPGDPEHCLASMGIYVFTARFLFEQLCLDATRPDSAPRLRPQHHPLARSTRTACSPSRFATKTASATPTGATWARSTPTSKPTWT